MSDRYDMITIADLLRVPLERRAAMLVDLGLWLAHVETLRAAIAEATGLPVEAPGTFIWLDDGKHDAHVSISVKGTGQELYREVVPLMEATRDA